MPERLECEVLQKARYINTLTFTLPLLHYHSESLSLRGGIVAYSTIPPADAHRRVVLDSVRQGGRAAFRRRLRQEIASATPPTGGYYYMVGLRRSAPTYGKR